MTIPAPHLGPVAATPVWLTPPGILAALGPFGLDPCAAIGQPWPTAAVMWTVEDDGLARPWAGRVWMNPPFGRGINRWLAKLAEHGDGIALLPARTETRPWFAHVWNVADAVAFVRGRPHFHRPDGSRAPYNCGTAIALVAYGEANALRLVASGLGAVVDTRRAVSA